MHFIDSTKPERCFCRLRGDTFGFKVYEKELFSDTLRVKLYEKCDFLDEFDSGVCQKKRFGLCFRENHID